MAAPNSTLRTSLLRWRSARRVVLASIVLSGAMATAAAVMHSGGCPASAIHAKTAALRAFTYSGLGVVIEQAEGDSIVVRRVLPGSPAEGALRPGMRITAVDGARYSELADWSDAIRGVPGSDVELEVRMGCHSRAITLTRDVVRMAY